MLRQHLAQTNNIKPHVCRSWLLPHNHFLLWARLIFSISAHSVKLFSKTFHLHPLFLRISFSPLSLLLSPTLPREDPQTHPFLLGRGNEHIREEKGVSGGNAPPLGRWAGVMELHSIIRRRWFHLAGKERATAERSSKREGWREEEREFSPFRFI